MRLAYIGEIVGKAGIFCIKKCLADFRQERSVDFILAGADGVTNGAGLGRNHAGYLRKLGLDLLCLGDSAFYKKDLVEHFDRLPYVLRPANISSKAPGLGLRSFKVKGIELNILVLLGQMGIQRIYADNPFELAKRLVDDLYKKNPFLIIDFHAQASAEKQALFYMLDGSCSAIVGSHTRVQTADAQCSAAGTAFISDAGRTGSQFSVGGTDIATRVAEYRGGIPDWTRPAWEDLEMQGVLIDLDKNGKAVAIEAFKLPCKKQD